jgi:hypothetical protein
MMRRLAGLVAMLATVAAVTLPVSAQQRHAVLVFGAAGGEQYEKTYAAWEEAIVGALHERFAFDLEQIVVLSGHGSEPAHLSTAHNVRRTFEALRRTARPDDLVFVLLVGHGTHDGETAKFNLVGPDLDATEWAALVEGVPGRLVFVNSAAASFPYLEALSAEGRIVITATDSAAQRYYTVFPELLARTLADPATDLDRNGRVSLWEVFVQVSAGVREHYEQRGQLATERPLLDDTGDGEGQEAGAPGANGVIARTTYLDADPLGHTSDPVLLDLLSRQRALEAEAEAMKLRKTAVPLAEWEAKYEQLMIELARVSRAIRSRS